jgi:hypothetical protein
LMGPKLEQSRVALRPTQADERRENGDSNPFDGAKWVTELVAKPPAIGFGDGLFGPG